MSVCRRPSHPCAGYALNFSPEIRFSQSERSSISHAHFMALKAHLPYSGHSCSPLAELLVFPNYPKFLLFSFSPLDTYAYALYAPSVFQPQTRCSCEDNPNLELSRRVSATVCLAISRHVVLSSLSPDAAVVGVYDRRKLIRLCDD